MKTSLEHKTVRPGSLSDYSFYYSKRNAPRTETSPSKPKRKLSIKTPLILLVIVATSLFYIYNQAQQPGTKNDAVASGGKTAPVVVAPPTNQCAANGYDKFIKISVSKRHLWACEGQKTVRDSAVITGIEKYDSTRTPVGTYKIYAKQADTVLTGTDEVGSWRMPVDYWMPFLDNQYGTYGFHDATWRKDSEFGNTDPYDSEKASHGCVELPLGEMKWLYEWAPAGTQLAVEA
jgi:hypothetical protein